MSLAVDELIDRVAARTRGTRSDPLGRDEVAQVVEATILELARAHDAGELELLGRPPDVRKPE